MSLAPPTRYSLLRQLKDWDDTTAWERFVDLYRPCLYRYLKKQGLQHADADDMVQGCLYAVAASISRFACDRDVGSFRGWLFTVARNRLRNLVAARRSHRQGSGRSTMLNILTQRCADAMDEDALLYDTRRERFQELADRVRSEFRPATWRAFWETAVEGKPVEAVAGRLGISKGAVYVARCRILARLTEEAQQYEDE